jgi:hypothetical protein
VEKTVELAPQDPKLEAPAPQPKKAAETWISSEEYANKAAEELINHVKVPAKAVAGVAERLWFILVEAEWGWCCNIVFHDIHSKSAELTFSPSK